MLSLICIIPIAGWMLNQWRVQINEAMIRHHLFLMSLALCEPFLCRHADGELGRDCVLRGIDKKFNTKEEATCVQMLKVE